MRRIFTLLTSAAIAASVLPSSLATSAQGTTLSYSVANERSMVNLTNQDRIRHGLRAYRTSSELARVARSQAMRMATTNRLYHNPQLRYAVTSYRWVGENVGYSPNSGSLEKAFMASPAHRANILNRKYTQIGIGAVVVNGRLWVSEVFRQPK